MAQEKYDIFISYRRKDENGKEWGTSIARNILQALEDRGYKGRVFFDHNKIGPEDFEKKILGAIKQAKVLLCVLTKNAMDNCVNEGDWVRREICKALESGLNIIFLNPDNEFNHKLLPKDFPKELDIVKTQNSLEIRSGQKFEIDMDDMVNTHIVPIIKPSYMVKRTPIVENDESVTVRIKSDLDCRIFNCGEELCEAKAGLYTTIRLPLGQNELRFEGLESVEDSYEQFIEIDDNRQKIIRVSLLEKYNARKKREAYLLSLEDDEFQIVEVNEKCGYMLWQSNEIVIPCQYDYASYFCDGLAKVGINDKYGFIIKTGKEIISLKYDYIYDFNDGLARVKLNGKYGFIDKIGREIISLKYDYAWDFRDGLAGIELNGKRGYINTIGKDITLKYDDVCDFRNGLVQVKLNGKYGFVDKMGKEVIPLKYDCIYDINDGLARVQLNSKWGYIDKIGNEVIPLMYDYAATFFAGKARVELNGEEFYIDKNGNKVE